MSRDELREIVIAVIRQMGEGDEDAPRPGCIFSDEPCDATTWYGINEEG